MTTNKLIEALQKMKENNDISGDELLYIGDKQESTDYFVRNADGKLTLKQEWY